MSCALCAFLFRTHPKSGCLFSYEYSCSAKDCLSNKGKNCCDLKGWSRWPVIIPRDLIPIPWLTSISKIDLDQLEHDDCSDLVLYSWSTTVACSDLIWYPFSQSSWAVLLKINKNNSILGEAWLGLSRFCARRILCRIRHPVQNMGSCAEWRKIYQMAQKMRKFCWFLLLTIVKITQYTTRPYFSFTNANNKHPSHNVIWTSSCW